MASTHHDVEQRLALFIDFENIAIGVRDAHYRKFDINLVLERLLEKGKILVKRAYADWSRYSDYKRSFHEAAIELIEVPQKSLGGKNSADIRLVVDAMDLAFQKGHLTSFVVASGDSDFSPLVSKLKENNKYVIGVGVKNSTSDLLLDNCDEFIFYEDLVRGQQRQVPVIANVPEKVQECFGLLVDSILALQRENKEVLWGSMVKETMKRKKPSFNETYYGFRTFSHLLEDAQRRGIVVLRRDQRSGSYIVDDLGVAGTAPRTDMRPEPPREARASEPGRLDEPRTDGEAASAESGTEGAAAPAAATAETPTNGRGRRRRGGRGRRARGGAASFGGSPSDAAGESSDTDAGGSGEDEDDGPEDDRDSAPEDRQADERQPDEGPERTPAPPAGEPEDRRPDPPPGPEPAAAATPNADQPEPSKGGAFGLFSWLRRDPSDKGEPRS